METTTRKSNRRRPWLAAILSLLMPGLGQLYCGAVIKCLWLLAFTTPAGILGYIGLVRGVPLNGSLVLLVYALSLIIYAIGIFDAHFTARRTREDYALKDYNRWDAYLLLFMAVSAGHIFSALYVRSNLLTPFKAGSASMLPSLLQGDQVFAERNAYLDRNPAVGDIVVFNNPENRKEDYIKRVVALEGDTVEIREGEIYINGTKLKREEIPASAGVPNQPAGGAKYYYENNGGARYRILLATPAQAHFRDMPATVVPKHHCFVLGDNRDNSLDSRSYGAIPIVGIVGKANFIFAPSQDWLRFGRIP